MFFGVGGFLRILFDLQSHTCILKGLCVYYNEEPEKLVKEYTVCSFAFMFTKG